MQKELDTNILSSRKESVDFRKHGFDGSMIFFFSFLEPGDLNRN